MERAPDRSVDLVDRSRSPIAGPDTEWTTLSATRNEFAASLRSRAHATAALDRPAGARARQPRPLRCSGGRGAHRRGPPVTALEVEYGDELVATDLRTGEQRTPADVEVDDRLLCLPSTTIECALFYERFDDDADLPAGVGSRFDYAYFDHRLYRIERAGGGTAEFVETDASDALDDLELDWADATGSEREAVEQGSVVTGSPIRHEGRLLQRGDSYYTLVRSGYADGSFCTGSGGDFCDGGADAHLRWQWARPLGLGLLGLAGVGAGLANLFPYLPYGVRRRVKNAV